MDEYGNMFGKRKNFKDTAYVMFNGERVGKKILCDYYGISIPLLNYRMNTLGMTVEEAVVAPKSNRGRRKKTGE